MCGIIGYIGDRQAPRILIDGLRRLEYRGYDSAGLAIFKNDAIDVRRCRGKISALEELVDRKPIKGSVGIGHTRWATHGRPSRNNAHPHLIGDIAVVHNGIVENYAELKQELIDQGEEFHSETDTEVISHLINRHVNAGMEFEKAVQKTIGQIQGAFAVVILNQREPDKIIAVKQKSPLVIGLGEGENFVGSDIPALISQTRKVLHLEDGEYAVITRDAVTLKNAGGRKIKREPITVQWSPAMAEKGGYKHFMLKEIFEQPRALADTLAGRVKSEQGQVEFEEFNLTKAALKKIKSVCIVACGTAWHAGLVGRYMIERHCRLPVEVDIASEFRYREPLVDGHTLMVVISQSGETADTLAALEEAKRLGCPTLAICNVLHSSIARTADEVIYTRAGPEIGVASTKAFTSQVLVMYMLTVYLGRMLGTLDEDKGKTMLAAAMHLPTLVQDLLEEEPKIKQIAHRLHKQPGFFFIGRGINFPIALEGALKLKEISYIHAEGYPAGELKHGPIALVDEHIPIVAICTRNVMYEKMISNLEEVAARDGQIIALISKKDKAAVSKKAAETIVIPETEPELTPLLLSIPLQLLAYHVAEFNGTDVDQPRNLAKSVTVE